MASRYNRQELLIGKDGQKRLGRSAAVIVGLGGLGSTAAQLLARAGVGNITVIDKGRVNIEDLHRQILYDENDIGKLKADVAAEKLRRINSEIRITAAAAEVDSGNIGRLVGKPDVVLDCTDNLETRFVINDYCLKNKLPWVHAAAVTAKAELMVFDFRKKNQPCYNCIFSSSVATETSATSGIIGMAPVTIASMQATEAIKLLLGKETAKGMVRMGIWQHKISEIKVKKSISCSRCKTS